MSDHPDQQPPPGQPDQPQPGQPQQPGQPAQPQQPQPQPDQPGRPSGVLQTDLKLSPEQLAELRRRWNEQTQGIKERG